MKRKSKVMLGIFLSVLLGLAVLIWYWFFDFDHSTLVGHDLTFKGQHYTFSSIAPQDSSTVKFRASGKTPDGDMVFERINDPNDNEVIVIPNSEMPPWLLYKKVQN